MCSCHHHNHSTEEDEEGTLSHAHSADVNDVPPPEIQPSSSPLHTPRKSLLARVAILMIRGYQTMISPYTPPACKYSPTCSAYTRQAIEIHGFFKGGWMGFWRIMRCNPFAKGGYDPVPPLRQIHQENEKK